MPPCLGERALGCEKFAGTALRYQSHGSELSEKHSYPRWGSKVPFSESFFPSFHFFFPLPFSWWQKKPPIYQLRVKIGSIEG